MAFKTCEMRVLYISVIMMCQFYEILSCLSITKCSKVLKTQYMPFFFTNTFTNPFFSLSWSLYPSPFCSITQSAHLTSDKSQVWSKLWRQYHCQQLENFKLKIPIQDLWIFHTSLLTRGQIALVGRLSLWALGAQTQAVKIKRNNLASVAY